MLTMAINLTPRELAICERLAAGDTAKEAASKLGISFRTVETLKYRAFKKLGVDSTVKLARVMFLREFGKETQ